MAGIAAELEVYERPPNGCPEFTVDVPRYLCRRRIAILTIAVPRYGRVLRELAHGVIIALVQ